MEAVGNDQATACQELARLEPEVVDRLSIGTGPALSLMDQLSGSALALDAAHDGRHVGDLDVEAALDIRRASGKRILILISLKSSAIVREPGGCSAKLVRAEGRRFPTHRCPVPASGSRGRAIATAWFARIATGSTSRPSGGPAIAA